MSGIRVRFAPSPTGYLHVGGARTALFNWLFARNKGGVFVLRIEDTDIERSSEEMVTSILDSMRWLGMDWDEGPCFQSEGLDRHRQIAMELMDRGKAYPCFCLPDELKKSDAYLYPRNCLEVDPEERRSRIAAGEPYALRFHVPAGYTEFTDLVYGSIKIDHENIDDFVLLRRDGNPTYQLAVVADDIHMEITHVIRGDDHLSNTPKQILLYQALNRPIPQFAHLPLILGPDKKRLSKRHGATSITSYKDAGYLPEAVANFLALLGWSPGDDVEVLSIEDLVRRFSLDRVTKKSAVFDIAKLEWLNGKYISNTPNEKLFRDVTSRWIEAGLLHKTEREQNRDWLLSLIDLLKTRVRLINDFTEAALPFLSDKFAYDEEAIRKRWKNPQEVIAVLENVVKELNNLDAFDPLRIEETVRALAERMGLSNSRIIHPIRVALTGRMAGPGLFALMVILGRQKCIERLQRATDYLRETCAECDEGGR